MGMGALFPSYAAWKVLFRTCRMLRPPRSAGSVEKSPVGDRSHTAPGRGDRRRSRAGRGGGSIYGQGWSASKRMPAGCRCKGAQGSGAQPLPASSTGREAHQAPRKALDSSRLCHRFGRVTSCRGCTTLSAKGRQIGTGFQQLQRGACSLEAPYGGACTHRAALSQPLQHLLQSCATPSCRVYGQRRAAMPCETDSPSGVSRMVESYRNQASFTTCSRWRRTDCGNSSRPDSPSGPTRDVTQALSKEPTLACHATARPSGCSSSHADAQQHPPA